MTRFASTSRPLVRAFPGLGRAAGRLAAAVAVGASSLLGVAAAPAPAQPGSYIVVLQDAADPRAVAQAHANDHAVKLKHTYAAALKGYAAQIPADRVARIKADPRVKFVSEDRAVFHTAQSAPTGVRRIGAATNGTTQTLANDGAGVRVAVLDTGADLSHPDLAGVVTGKNCMTGAPLGAPAQDDHGHGTHVAGTIAARDDGAGVVGVAPAAQLVAVKVLGPNGGAWSEVICGIDYVTGTRTDSDTTNDVHVANMSLGGGGSVAGPCGGTSDALHLAICNSVKAGVTYVVAAGNDGINAANFVPAAYPEVITVSAWSDGDGTSRKGTNPSCWQGQRDEAWATFTNYGSIVDIAAPGVCIASTALGGGTAVMSGTSMASPHVAGAAALYLAKNKGATPAAVRQALVAGHTTALKNDPWHAEDLLNAAGL